MRPLPFREVQRKLLRAGFAVIGQTGSHVKFILTTPHGTRTAIVPKTRDVPAGTLRSILRQAGLNEDEFQRL